MYPANCPAYKTPTQKPEQNLDRYLSSINTSSSNHRAPQVDRSEYDYKCDNKMIDLSQINTAYLDFKILDQPIYRVEPLTLNNNSPASSSKPANSNITTVPAAYPAVCGADLTIEISEDNKLFNNIYNKIHGMLIAHHLGDALGAQFEFNLQLLPQFTGKLEYRIISKSQYHGTRYSVLGQVTDDTLMTLALASTLIDEYNRDMAILAYEEFANSNGRLGKNTASLFKGVKTINGYESKYASKMAPPLLSDDPNYLSTVKTLRDVQSNGSLMRASPLVVVFDGNVIEDTQLTNPNPFNEECGVLYVNALRMLINNMHPSEVFENISKKAKDSRIKMMFMTISRQQNVDMTGKDKGWVGHAFFCAMYVLYQMGRMIYAISLNPSNITTNINTNIDNNSSKNNETSKIYNHLISSVIRFGGDTDTNAAIAGAIVGAYLGYEALIVDPLFRDNMTLILHADPNAGELKVKEPAATKYHPNNASNYAVSLAKLYIANHCL
jgi:ADP-ribosylglycohydrolase